LSFFDEVDDIGIVEDHVNLILGIQDNQASKLIGSYNEVRKNLMERLKRTKSDTFTAQQLRGVLAQIDAGLEAMQETLSGEMKSSALKTAMKGVEHITKEIEKFSKTFTGAVTPINLNAAIIAQDTNKFLVNKYDSSIASYSQGVRQAVTSGLTTAMIEEAPMSIVHDRLDGFFKGETWKLDRMARTELHNVYNLGKLLGMQQTKDEYVPDLMKTLYQPMDHRTGADSKYAAKLKLIVPLDKPFHYTWKAGPKSKAYERIFMTPPDRPNDRSVLIPYRKEWSSN
jgi:hypothetical protein